MHRLKKENGFLPIPRYTSSVFFTGAVMTFSRIGVIHLLPLPGTPHARDPLHIIIERAIHDANVILSAGFDGLILENFGDAPFVQHRVPPHIISCMTRIAWEIKQRFPQPFTLGINVLRNDAQAAIAIAKAVGADFVRINVHIGSAWTDQGLIEGSAYENLMYRRSISSQVQIASDVLVKHAAPAGSSELLLLAKDTVLRGGADVLILTGTRTGTTTAVEEVQQVRSILPNTPLWIGSGVTPQNIRNYTSIASGAIIGSYLHQDGLLDRPLCASRAEEFQHIFL